MDNEGDSEWNSAFPFGSQGGTTGCKKSKRRIG
ncbi:hypothetical protein G210_4942 [Candida maltosa Xu316]|uniref:Uncharacterized protein n=1 Tax=Candida maltosa (strain Xu316) TaxID=1245528 RepID=M3HTR7_CANMX|nr:hypothetical protein G210_4942 [Candida maltosa Xu316]